MDKLSYMLRWLYTPDYDYSFQYTASNYLLHLWKLNKEVVTFDKSLRTWIFYIKVLHWKSIHKMFPFPHSLQAPHNFLCFIRPNKARSFWPDHNCGTGFLKGRGKGTKIFYQSKCTHMGQLQTAVAMVNTHGRFCGNGCWPHFSNLRALPLVMKFS